MRRQRVRAPRGQESPFHHDQPCSGFASPAPIVSGGQTQRLAHLVSDTSMIPSLPIPTDNIYKFACLFGLALIIVSIFSFVSTYAASLERKVKYMEVIISLEAKTERNKVEQDLLTLNKKLLEVSQSNEHSSNLALSLVLGVGIGLSVLGATKWHLKIQLRDDKLAQLQIQKLEAELAVLRQRSTASSSSPAGGPVDLEAPLEGG